VLHVIGLAHLGDNLVRGGEFGVGSPYFRSTVAGSHRLRESWRGHHHYLFDNTT